MNRVSYQLITVCLLIVALSQGLACRQNSNNPTSPAATDPRSMDTDSQPDITPSTAPKNFPVGIVVPVGTIGYKVESFSYRDSLTDGTKPDNGKKFLWLNLRSVNTGPREADYAAFKLLDGTKEYDLSSKTGKVSESLNAVKKLAQGEVKSGVLIFELPPATNPKLKIIAAPPVKDEMFISLTAPAATPSKTAVKPSASPAK